MKDTAAIFFECPACRAEPKAFCRDLETDEESIGLLHASRIAEVRRFEDSIICRMWREQYEAGTLIRRKKEKPAPPPVSKKTKR